MRQINFADSRMRVWAVEDGAIEHSWQFDVISVTGRAGRLDGSIEPGRIETDYKKSLVEFPGRRFVIGNNNSDLLDFAGEAQLQCEPARHLYSPPRHATRSWSRFLPHSCDINRGAVARIRPSAHSCFAVAGRRRAR